MTISVNWATKVIFVPQAFLTSQGGSKYLLDINTLRNSLKDIEDSDDGMAYPDTHRHSTESVLSGVTYSRQLEIINGYTVIFENTGTPYIVSCSGANHNLADVTNFDGGMSMIVGNSAGLQTVNTAGGGGATAAEVWAYGSRTLTSAVAPTAEQNATATLAALIEGGLTLQDVLRIVLAVTSGDATGLEGSSMVFKSLDGTKNRVEASYVSGTRNVTAVDPS